MKIILSFNFKHENHMRIELNGFLFCRCTHHWYAEEYGYIALKTDSVCKILRYQYLVQFQSWKSKRISLNHLYFSMFKHVFLRSLICVLIWLDEDACGVCVCWMWWFDVSDWLMSLRLAVTKYVDRQSKIACWIVVIPPFRCHMMINIPWPDTNTYTTRSHKQLDERCAH